MNVTWLGSDQFHVSSRSRAIKHLVELSGLNGNGECSCEHFQFKLRPEVQAGGFEQCSHIKAVWAEINSKLNAHWTKFTFDRDMLFRLMFEQ